MVPKFISQASLLPFSAFFTLLFPESCSQCLKGAWRSLLRAWGTLCYCCSVTKSCLTLCNPWTAAFQASLSFTISWSVLGLMSIESVMPTNHLILYRPLLLLPSVFPRIRVFPNELALHIKWPKYWSFIFSISLFNEYSRLISFRINWFDLLAVQRTLKSLLQHHSSKASILMCSAYGPTLTSIHDYWKNHSFD